MAARPDPNKTSAPDTSNVSNTPQATRGLESVISESRERIEAAKPKGRGRPKGSTTVNRTEGQNAASAAPKVDMASLIKTNAHLARVPFSAVATIVECPEIELDDSEAQAIGESLANLEVLLTPNMSPFQSALLGVVVTAGTISFGKYLIYREAQKSKLAVQVKGA